MAPKNTLNKTNTLEEFNKFCELNWVTDEFKKKAQELLEFDISKNKDKLKFDKKIDKILSKESESKIFRLKNDKSYINEFLKTFVAIGINNNEIDFKKLSEIKETDTKSYKNHNTNYKNWLWKKLMLWKEDRKLKSVDEIEKMALPYISSAIDHIKEFMNIFNVHELVNLKSEFFETIHTTWTKQLSVYQYIEMIFDLDKSKKSILKQEWYANNPQRYEWVLKNIEMWKFEIQRLLGLALLYLDREKNHVHQHIEEDISFIVWKLLEIVPEKQKNEFINIKTWVDRPLYPYVNTHNIYWKKNDKWYDLINKEKKWYTPLKMDSLKISWETRDYKNNKMDIDLKHIAVRGKKSWFSSIEKLIRKWFSSFNEILDHKGFIFVVDNFEEGDKLLKVLENKLWTLRSSWIEEPKSMKELWWNNFSSCDYDCMKWVIKIPYKWKLIKQFFDILDSHMELLNSWLKESFDELKSQINEIDIENDENVDKIEKMFLNLNDKRIFSIYSELKQKFNEKSYNIEVEIQIFDMNNYLKAEIDEKSKAYHGKYKMRQLTENIPIYFPIELYWKEKIESPIRRIIKDNS